MLHLLLERVLRLLRAALQLLAGLIGCRFVGSVWRSLGLLNVIPSCIHPGSWLERILGQPFLRQDSGVQACLNRPGHLEPARSDRGRLVSGQRATPFAAVMATQQFVESPGPRFLRGDPLHAQATAASRPKSDKRSVSAAVHSTVHTRFVLCACPVHADFRAFLAHARLEI